MNQKGMQGNIQTNETIPSICSKIGKYELQEISRTVTVKKSWVQFLSLVMLECIAQDFLYLA